MAHRRRRDDTALAGPDASKNAFKNDGSFLEMFKRMQESQASSPAAVKVDEPSSSSSSSAVSGKAEAPKQPVPVVAKRRGGRTLPVGVVKKTKKDDVDPELKASSEERGSAWMQYMTEVRKYKERTCDEENKVRPLVK